MVELSGMHQRMLPGLHLGKKHRGWFADELDARRMSIVRSLQDVGNGS